MLIEFYIMIWCFLSLPLFADANSQKCSSLLESLIETTQSVRAKRVELNSLREPEPKEWGVGAGKLKVLYQDGKITLEGTKEPISIQEKLTPEQLERFKSFTEKQSDRFDLKFDSKSNRSALKDGVNYARLHEAFYGKDLNPLKAAKEIESLIGRSARFNTHLKTQIRSSETTGKFLENVGTLAENLDSLTKLHSQGKLEQAVKDYKEQREQEQGAKILDEIVGREPSVSLDEVVQNTAVKKQQQNPEAVEIEINFSHDDPLRLHIERTKMGKLKITPQAKPGLSIKNLKQLVEWLQGKGYDGKSYDWRTYELVESEPF